MSGAREHGRPSVGEREHGRPSAGERLTYAMRLLATAPIVAYQRLLGPALPRRCRYEPTCSHYAVQAIREYGILRGLVLAGWRLLRCNPWSPGGFDPVRAQKLFRQPQRLTGADAGHPST